MRGTKSSSEEAVLAALASRRNATGAEVAAATGLGRSTVGRMLVRLERDERVRRSLGGRQGGRRCRIAGRSWAPLSQLGDTRAADGCVPENWTGSSSTTSQSTPRMVPWARRRWRKASGGHPAPSPIAWLGSRPRGACARSASGHAATAPFEPVGAMVVEAWHVVRTLRALEMLAVAPRSAPELAAGLLVHVRTARRILRRPSRRGTSISATTAGGATGRRCGSWRWQARSSQGPS